MKQLYIPTFNKLTKVDKEFLKLNPNAMQEKNPDIVVVSGGDGSLLHAIQDYGYHGVPFFGIAAGTVNFLMNEVNIADLEKDKFINLNIIESYTLQVKVIRKRTNGSVRRVFQATATNDIVLGNRIMDYNDFEIKGIKELSDNEQLSGFTFRPVTEKEKPHRVKGMGLVFSTALGSTAFFTNNHGEIIENMTGKTIGVATIVSDLENSFNLHTELEDKIRVTIKSERTKCSMYIDGETQVFELKRGDKVIVTKGPKVKLAFLDLENFKEKRKKMVKSK